MKRNANQISFLPEISSAKPFLKWAGGKTQLLPQLDTLFPEELKIGKIQKYAEPFIGGGAVFFHIMSQYPLEESIILDINPELILAYKTIKLHVSAITEYLGELEIQHLDLSEEKRKEHFYQIRSDFNQAIPRINYFEYSRDWIKRTSQIIFLNKTCFNGLFRVNSKGEFNVPFGRYKNPRICDAANLNAVSKILQETTILLGEFTEIETLIDENTFVYFDPPYRPLNASSSFTSYSKYSFNDREQTRLANFYSRLDKKGAKLMLSNSDPKNSDPNDNFFENLYNGYSIKRIDAIRSINSNGEKRGKISELCIINY